MSRTMKGALKYYVFDYFLNPEEPYTSRYLDLSVRLANFKQSKAYKEVMANNITIELVPQREVFSLKQLGQLEEQLLALGFEGVMTRTKAGIYKYGRSTTNQGILLKVKRWIDAEAKIVGFKEQYGHIGKATVDALGYTERDHKKENMEAKGCLGALMCECPGFEPFDVGSGFTQGERTYIWANQDKYFGRLITFKYFEVTADNSPRFPIFKGFRPELED